MTVASVIDAARSALTPAERRVADVVLTSPEAVAFGTVAEVAQRAATSGATVVRLATKLGYDGFSGAAERRAGRAGPAAAPRRRTHPRGAADRRARAGRGPSSSTTWRARSRRVAVGAFDETVAALGRRAVPRCTCWPATRRAASACCSPTSSRCCAPACPSGSGPTSAWPATSPTCGAATCSSPSTTAATSAGCSTRRTLAREARRPRRRPVRQRPVAPGRPGVAHVRRAGRGAPARSTATSARSPLINALVAGAAAGLRRSATDRLDGIEAAWRQYGALLDE